ncbi:hypothetical protein LCGC14_0816050 [marine sediment metagenome]|uniref:Zinc-ribbon domain-containing protein n=1 Tax=marine sediment metagenome TaxID=412755 RepID=A0A0F9Q5J1_9ZZZZ
MIFQYIDSLQTIADIIGAIVMFLAPLVMPIGNFMKSWITAVMGFLDQYLGSSDFTFYIIIFVILIVSAVVINIIWPGDRPGSIFSKSLEKIEEEKIEVSEEEDIIDQIKRCKDCGNPIGDSEICPLCGARN